jgi:5-methylcytosine-specific restriction endonuclease McrA
MSSFPVKVRREIFERASGLCERKLPNGKRCLAPATEAHHIIPKRMGGRKKSLPLFDDKRNGMAACRPCHVAEPFWNEDAADLVPGKEYREWLKKIDRGDFSVKIPDERT